MIDPEELDELKKLLPANYRKEIMRRTDVSRPTIDRFFRGVKIRVKNADTIHDAALQLILEKQERAAERESLMNRFRQNSKQTALKL